MKYVTAAESVSIIKSDDRVFIHSAAAGPQQLIIAMAERTRRETGVAEAQNVRTE